MKTILFYDNEGTGLVNFERRSHDPSQPRVTQLAAELCVEETGETLREMDLLILPSGWVIPEDVQQLTGITMERALADGVPVELAVDLFIDMWKDSDLRCGHNESFDMRMIRIELVRHPKYSMETVGADMPFADYWKAGPKFCTQSNSTKIINAARPKGEKKKTASLAEAYEFFTGQPLDGAHDARIDVKACKAVYYGIKKHLAALA
jgi:DNA polymerase-3 subunit epsilon